MATFVRLSCCLVLAGILSQTSANVNPTVNKEACIRDSSVNPSAVEKAEHGEIGDVRSLKCYFKCYYENAGYLDAKGAIQADKLRANIPSGISKTMANKAIDLCSTKKAKDVTDACETAYLVQKCLAENSLYL